MFVVVVVVVVDDVVVVVVVGTPIENYVASEETVVAVEYVVAKAASFTFLLLMKIVNSTQTRLLLNGNNFPSIELFRQRPTCNVTPAQSS